MSRAAVVFGELGAVSNEVISTFVEDFVASSEAGFAFTDDAVVSCEAVVTFFEEVVGLSEAGLGSCENDATSHQVSDGCGSKWSVLLEDVDVVTGTIVGRK